MANRTSIFLIFIFVILLSSIFFCSQKEQLQSKKSVPIDFEQTANADKQIPDPNANSTLYLAISAMTSPRETYRYYEQFVDYLAEKLSRPIQFKQRKTYQEVNSLLEKGEIDIGLVCSGAYVVALQDFPLRIIAVPVIRGKPYYNAYIIVNKMSSFQKLEDLRGRSFAFTDPLSNTGYLYVLSRLKCLGTTPDQFFSETMFTYAHDRSIQAVARKLVDGATVDGLIYEYLKEYYPEKVENVSIAEVSEDFGMPPIVASRSLDDRTLDQIRQVLFTMHHDSTGQRILKKLMIDRFTSGDSTSYKKIMKNLQLIRP